MISVNVWLKSKSLEKLRCRKGFCKFAYGESTVPDRADLYIKAHIGLPYWSSHFSFQSTFLYCVANKPFLRQFHISHI